MVASSGHKRVLEVLRQQGVDVNQTGRLSEDQFVKMLQSVFPSLDQAWDRQIFRLVDIDNSGKASLDEFAFVAGHALELVDAFEPSYQPKDTPNLQEQNNLALVEL